MKKLLVTLALHGLLAAPAAAQTTPNPAVDSDGDGVNDVQDVEPCDDRVSARAFLPSGHGYGMVLFEDNWPQQGDFDFNDAVIAFHQVLELDSSGRMTRLIMNLEVLAVGARYDNGLALRLPTSAGNVLTAQLFREGDPTTVGEVALWPSESEAVLTLAPSLHDLFGAPNELINAVPGTPSRPYQHLTLVVELESGALSPADALFDLFLFDASRGVEIHMPRYGPTSRMNAALVGTADDDPNRNFTTRSGIPFGLAFLQEVSYPAEGVAIDRLFPGIVEFGASRGTRNQRFFDSPVVRERYTDQYQLSPLRLAFEADQSCFQAVPGECGPAQDAGAVAPPAPADLCRTGTPSAVTGGGSSYSWSCQGVYSTPTQCQTTRWACLPNESEACSPSTDAQGVRVCAGDGSQWGACQFTGCAPGTIQSGSQCVRRVCAPGSVGTCTVNGGLGQQTCNLSGTGWSTCLPRIEGVCGVAHGRSYGEISIAPYLSGQCASGFRNSPNLWNGRISWTCRGARGGGTASCSATFVECNPRGQQRACNLGNNTIQGCQQGGYWGYCVQRL